jgi:thiamine biosynthesis lipoprotein ApbE
MKNQRMKLGPLVIFCLLALVCNGLEPTAAARASWHVAQFENVLGTSLELKFGTSSDTVAARAETVALAEIERVAKLLSGYDQTSEFNRWLSTTGQPVRVSRELFEVLHQFEQWRIQTNGALDPAAQIVTKLWKQAAAQQRVPTPAERQTAVTAIQQPHYRLDAVNQFICQKLHCKLRCQCGNGGSETGRHCRE